STCAASLPELSSRPSHSVSTVYFPPASRPTAELPGSKSRSSGSTSTTSCGSSSSSSVSASSSFCVLAGMPYSWGPHAPSTAPVSRSATNQYVADNWSGRSGASGGTTRPAVASAAPPTSRSHGSCTGVGGGDGRCGGGSSSTTGQGTNGGGDGDGCAAGTGPAPRRQTRRHQNRQ